MNFTLRADNPPDASGILAVKSIEVRRGNDQELLQRIDGLATQTPWSAQAPGLEFVDMNFDGYIDMRLIESRPAGPNVTYLHWLFDPAGGRFVASAALDELAAPRFDKGAREVHSDWRDSAVRYGSDRFRFDGNQLMPLQRETREYQRPGVYTLRVSHWLDGRWQVVQTRQGRDP